MARIELDDVHVSYPLLSMGHQSLKKTLIGRAQTGGELVMAGSAKPYVHALNAVTLRLNEGDRVGLVGGNGSGKTTLLRVLAGIHEPTAGIIRVAGSITTLFSLNVGVENEATGYENIEMRGLAAGLTKAQIAEKVQDIAAFTGLGSYLELPIHVYSSGMRTRLLFAIATAIDPDILLMDEWLSAGDKAFVDQARARLNTVVHGANILVLVSHNHNLIRETCNRVLHLDAGRIVADGPPDEVLDAPARTDRPKTA
mgnify:CR=1 FL=1